MIASNDLEFDERGLIPAIVQHARTGEILMLGWMNEEALQLSLQSESVHFWSRSRKKIWQKGESSKNFLLLHDIKVDCDGDALLVKALPKGPTCHTGNDSCFYRDLEG